MKSNQAEFYRLEDRVLFEAGAVVQAAAAADVNANTEIAVEAETAAQNDVQSDIADLASVELPPEVIAEAVTETAAESEPEKVLVVINSSVADAGKIVNDLGENYEILRLEAGTDALDTINDYLDAHSDTSYSALHIVSHGNDGYVTLNGKKISGDTLNPADWKAIGEHLSEDADILLYGCDTAKSDKGKAFIQTIADLTGADVAASTDSTGANGDWDLEYRTGLIESVTLRPVSEYAHDLTSQGVNLTITAADGTVGETVTYDTFNAALAAVDKTAEKNRITFSQETVTVSDTCNISGGNIEIDGLLYDKNGNGKYDKADGDTMITFNRSVAKFNETSNAAVTWKNMVINNTETYSGNSFTDLIGNATVTLKNITLNNMAQIAWADKTGNKLIMDGVYLQTGTFNGTEYKNNHDVSLISQTSGSELTLDVKNSVFSGAVRNVVMFNLTFGTGDVSFQNTEISSMTSNNAFISVTGRKLTMNNVTFQSNICSAANGMIVLNTGADSTMDGVNFYANDTCLLVSPDTSASLSMKNCTVDDSNLTGKTQTQWEVIKVRSVTLKTGSLELEDTAIRNIEYKKGILCQSLTNPVTLDSVEVSGSSFTDYFCYADGEVKFQNCTISDNNMKQFFTSSWSQSFVEIKDSVFTNNIGYGTTTSDILIKTDNDCSSVDISGTKFSGNSNYYTLLDIKTKKGSIDNSLFVNNTVALTLLKMSANGNPFTLSNSYIVSNHSTASSSSNTYIMIQMATAGSYNVQDTVFAYNSGGKKLLQAANTAGVSSFIDNCRFYENSTPEIFVVEAVANAVVTNSLLYNNSGTCWFGKNITLLNCTAVNNGNMTADQPAFAYAINSVITKWAAQKQPNHTAGCLFDTTDVFQEIDRGAVQWNGKDITFTGNGATVTLTGKDYVVKPGSAAEAGVLAAEKNNVFYYSENGIGWFNIDGTAVSADIVITAGDIISTDINGRTRTSPYVMGADSRIYKEITVTFDGNTAGTGTMDAVIISTGMKKIELTNTFVSGWTFLGFDDESGATVNVDYSASGNTAVMNETQIEALLDAGKNITLFAIWKKDIAVSYAAADSTAQPPDETITVYNGAAEFIWTPPEYSTAPDGWTFAGWSRDESAVSDGMTASQSFTVTDALTLYAVYSRSVALSYNANGGTGTAPAGESKIQYRNHDGSKFSAVSLSVAENTFSKSGYSFLTWNTKDDASGGNYAAGAEYKVTDDSSPALFAVWNELLSVTISAADNSADGNKTDGTTIYGDNVTLTAIVKDAAAGTVYHYQWLNSADPAYSKIGTFTGSADGNNAITLDDVLDTVAESGTYTVKVWADGKTEADAVTADLAAEIKQAAPSVTVNNLADNKLLFTYGETVTVSAGASGVNSETVSGQFVYEYYEADQTTKLASAPVNAGTYYVKAVFTSGDANYTDGSATAELTISKAILKTDLLTVNGEQFSEYKFTKIYDGKRSFDELENLTFKIGDTDVTSAVTGILFADANVADGNQATVSFDVNAIANYTISTASLTASAEVTEKSVILVWTSKNISAEDFYWEYNGTAQAPGMPEIQGLAENESLTVNVTLAGEKLTGDQSINAGDYTATATLADSGSFKAGNYRITAGETQSYSITPYAGEVVVSVTGNSGTVTYSGSEQSVSGYTVSIDNTLYEESNFTLSREAVAKGTNAGTYQMGLTKDMFSNISGNFSNVVFDVTDGNLTIGNADITAVAKDYSGIYDGQSHNITVGDITVVNNQAYKIEYSLTGADGSYSDSLELKNVSDSATVYYRITAANHNDLTGSAEVTISNAALNVTAENVSGTADGSGYSIAVNAATVDGTDAVIVYGTTSGIYTLTESPVFTEAGTYIVYYQVSAANHDTVTGSASITLTAAPSVPTDPVTPPDSSDPGTAPEVPPSSPGNREHMKSEATALSAPGQSSVGTVMMNHSVMGIGAGNSVMISSTEAQRHGAAGLLYSFELRQQQKAFEESAASRTDDPSRVILLSSIEAKILDSVSAPGIGRIKCGETAVSDHLNGREDAVLQFFSGTDQEEEMRELENPFDLSEDDVFSRLDLRLLTAKAGQFKDGIDLALEEITAV